MKKDRTFQAVLLGFPIIPVIEIYTQIMKQLDFSSLSALEAISLMWLKKPNIPLGILGALGLISWFSILSYHSSKIWGMDYFPLKTMLLGMTAESVMFIIFGVLGQNELLVHDVSGNFVHATASAISSLAAGFLMRKYLFNVEQRKD